MQDDTISNAIANLTGAMERTQKSVQEAIKKMAVMTGVLSSKRNTKHNASKKGYKHLKPIFDYSVWGDEAHPFPKRPLIPTNHERVVIGRAHKLGISVKEYQNHFSQELK